MSPFPRLPLSAPPSSAGQRWEQLDGIRGVAILMVVVFHGFYWNPAGPRWEIVTGAFLTTGALGVQIFFALSGFLISYPFFRARAADPLAWYVPGYAGRRALKI